jgi:curved DNA-binding protein CbpA
MAEETRRSLVASHHDVLGVAQSAGEAEIREAEMALRKIHDHRAHLGDAAATDALRRLNEASAVLLDPLRRAEYEGLAQTLWEGLVDVAPSPTPTRGERLDAVRAWSSEGPDLLRAATLLDGPEPHHLLGRQGLLGDR